MRTIIYEELDKMIQSIPDCYSEDIDFVVGVSRGGLIPAVMLATRFDKPLVTAYIDKQDNVYLDMPGWLKDKRVLIVDDAVRTGKTLSKIEKLVSQQTDTYKTFVVVKLQSAEIKIEKEPYFLLSSREEVKFPWDYNIIE